jgi:hypothetical protein
VWQEATRGLLEQRGGTLRQCYALFSACHDCGYLRRLLMGARIADEFRAALHEINMFIHPRNHLIPLITLVDNSANSRPAKVPMSQLLHNLLTSFCPYQNLKQMMSNIVSLAL